MAFSAHKGILSERPSGYLTKKVVEKD